MIIAEVVGASRSTDGFVVELADGRRVGVTGC